MIKEIKVTLLNGYEKTYLTETKVFLNKKQEGWDMIGFYQLGKKRNTWIPIGANVMKIAIYDAGTGRRLDTITP